MLRRSLRRFDYRTERLGDKSTLVISKKEIDYDHVAIDTSGLVGIGLRLAKSVGSEGRRHKEVARHVGQGIYQVLNRFRPTKTLSLFMDGSEILHKAQKTRASTITKKTESRLARLPGTPLMQAVEDRIIKMMPENRQFPPEVVFSGTCCDGPMEQKLSAWALDVASRDRFKPTDSLLLVGGSELFLNSLALTPFYNVVNAVQSGSDFKQTNIQDILQWLNCGERAKAGDNAFLAKVRTDVVLLYILCHGASVSELGAVVGLMFADLMDRYLERVNKASAANSGGSGSSSASSASSPFLFEEKGNDLRLNVNNLLDLLQRVLGPTRPVVPLANGACEDLLELALQTHSMLCAGVLPAPRFVARDLVVSANASSSGGSAGQVGPQTFAAHLAFMVAQYKDGKPLAAPFPAGYHDRRDLFTSRYTGMVPAELNTVAPTIAAESTEEEKQPAASGSVLFVSAKKEALDVTMTTGPLTAAEYTVISQPTSAEIEKLVLQIVGKVMRADAAKRLLTIQDPSVAAREVRSVMGSSARAHRCLHFSPSYCWLQNEKSKMWNFVYIDLGVRQRKMETRAKRNEEAGAVLTVSVASDGPAVFATATQTWEPVPSFPFLQPPGTEVNSLAPVAQPTGDGTPAPSPAAAAASNLAGGLRKPKDLSVLSWNVMFDRYSGKPTPLGMPGIDWCSPKRYPVLAKVMKACDADVIGMQEVEPQFWEFLAAQPWIRQNYYFSCNASGPAVNPWGVLMMVHRRVPVANITHHNIPAWSGHLNLMPVVSVDMSHAPVHVAAMHLLAPYTKGHENARQGQDNALKQRMLKTITGDCVTMGDFNDWPTNEFSMEAGSNYLDVWPHLRPREFGKTMDETNTFAKLKIEELFFGRADKIFLRSKRLKPTSIEMVGTRSVNEENGNTDAPAYLFPSDHFGLLAKFTTA